MNYRSFGTQPQIPEGPIQRFDLHRFDFTTIRVIPEYREERLPWLRAWWTGTSVIRTPQYSCYANGVAYLTKADYDYYNNLQEVRRQATTFLNSLESKNDPST